MTSFLTSGISGPFNKAQLTGDSSTTEKPSAPAGLGLAAASFAGSTLSPSTTAGSTTPVESTSGSSIEANHDFIISKGIDLISIELTQNQKNRILAVFLEEYGCKNLTELLARCPELDNFMQENTFKLDKKAFDLLFSHRLCGGKGNRIESAVGNYFPQEATLTLRIQRSWFELSAFKLYEKLEELTSLTEKSSEDANKRIEELLQQLTAKEEAKSSAEKADEKSASSSHSESNKSPNVSAKISEIGTIVQGVCKTHEEVRENLRAIRRVAKIQATDTTTKQKQFEKDLFEKTQKYAEGTLDQFYRSGYRTLIGLHGKFYNNSGLLREEFKPYPQLAEIVKPLLSGYNYLSSLNLQTH